MALDALSRLPAPASDHPSVSGLVVDIPSEGGFVTVVALTDDTTSMYTSTGGGVIGAGEHDRVAQATQALLRVVEDHQARFGTADGDELPRRGQVRFHLLAASGRRRADVPEDAFWGRADHDLMPVIAATQDVISEMRHASPD